MSGAARIAVLCAVTMAAGCGGGTGSTPPAPSEHAAAAPAGDGASPSGPADAASTSGGGPGLGSGAGRAKRAAPNTATPPEAPPPSGAAATSEEEMPRVISGQAAGREAREQSLLESSARHLSDPRFREFHAIATPYLEVVRTMRPLDEKFASGTITPEERERYWKLDAKKSELWEPIHAFMYQDRWTKEDRKAMGQWLALMGNAPSSK